MLLSPFVSLAQQFVHAFAQLLVLSWRRRLFLSTWNKRKAYKSNDELLNELINAPESKIDFDHTWNESYTLIRCGGCNGPMLGHSA